jgi:hypothetical protein
MYLNVGDAESVDARRLRSLPRTISEMDKTPSAKANSEIGYIVGWCAFTSAFTAVSALGGWFGFTRWSLIDAGLVGIAAWRIDVSQSRTWAIIVLVEVLLGAAERVSENFVATGAVLIPLYFVIRGLIGVFKFHKLKASTDAIQPL